MVRRIFAAFSRIDWREILWAVLPGIICCLAILYPFYLSGGEFVYLDWSGGTPRLETYSQFAQTLGRSWLDWRWVPLLVVQLPFVLVFGASASAIFSKLFFLSLFAAGSAGLYLLLKDYPKRVYLLSVAILSFSPFVYERIMMGQFIVAAFVLVLPLCLYLATRFAQFPSTKNALLLAAGVTFLNFQLQGFVINFCAVAAYLSINAALNWSVARRRIAEYGKFGLIFVALNLYWLVPFFLLPQSSVFSAMGPDHLSFYRPQLSTGFNTLLKSAMMYGSWREYGAMLAFKSLPPLFVFGFITALVVFCTYALLRDPKNPLFITLAGLWTVGVVLATGISHPWTASIFNFLFSNVPFFSGFRDSNKFVELVVISYAVLAPIGLHLAFEASDIARRFRGLGKILVGAAFLVAFVLVVAYCYPSLGLWGQLQPVEVPLEYHLMPALLPAGASAFAYPTGIYHSFSWSAAAGLDGRVASPLGSPYPSALIVVPGSLDMAGLSSSPAEACVLSRNVSCLVGQGVDYALFDSCTTIKQDSAWFSSRATKIKGNGCLTLFKLG